MYPHERSLVKRLANKPFALIGVNSDKDKKKLKVRMKKENITWRSFWNGPQGTGGPISKAWGVRGWPTIYVIDAEGIIRYKNARGPAMDKAVNTLLREMGEEVADTGGAGEEKVSARQKGDSEMVGKPAPPIALKRLHRAKGTTFKLASHKNKDVVILDFWATWCPPCRKAMPILEKVAKEYEDRGVVLCSINIKEKPNKIRTFLKQQNLNVDVALDTDGKVATKYNVEGIPTMVIVDKKGNIAHVKVGLSGELEEDLHELLDELVTDDEVALK